ncbi:MAG: hypothetical protein IKZ87_07670 [Actinomycetaceae bacterium]|nr:hypothetical protein [Actinomycetaceae bacterium]
MNQWDEDQSLRDFVDSLSDTAVDLEPVGPPKTVEELEQEQADEAAKAKKKRIALIAGIVVLLLIAGISTALWLSNRSAVADDYAKARAEYEQLREQAQEKLEDAESAAEDCRVSINDSYKCGELDDAITDLEEKSAEIPEVSPSSSAVEDLKNATKELSQSLEKFDGIYEQILDEMGESVGLNLKDLIAEGKKTSSSAKSLLSEYRGTLDNASDADEMNTLLGRLNDTIDEASALLENTNTGTLAAGTKPAQARSVAKKLRQLIDDIEDEKEALRASHNNYMRKHEPEPTESSALPSPNAGSSSPSSGSGGNSSSNSGNSSGNSSGADDNQQSGNPN